MIFSDCTNNINHDSVLTGVDILANLNKDDNNDLVPNHINHTNYDIPENLNGNNNDDLVPNHINHTNELDDTTENNDANTGNTNVNADNHNTNDSNSAGVLDEDVDSRSTGVDEVVDDNDITGVAPEDCDDKFVPPDDDDSDSSNGNDGNTSTVAEGITTCLGCGRKPYNYANKFPVLYDDTGHVSGMSDTLCLRPYYYYDDKLNLKLGAGFIYSSRFFTGVDATNANARANANMDYNANATRNTNANGDAGDDATNANI